jgi:hypothetical protein
MSELKTNKISTNDGNNVAIDTALGLKSYDTTGRDALTSVAGDMIFNSDDNKVQAYDGSSWIDLGALTQGSALSVDYLVAGGGGGACRHDTRGTGGGGAGAVTNSYNYATESSGGRYPDAQSTLSLYKNVRYNVGIGAGGAKQNAGNTRGFSGTGSYFHTIVAPGGGAGSHGNPNNGRASYGQTGANGGGSNHGPSDGANSSYKGLGMDNHGFDGGGGYAASNNWHGGGGGGVGGNGVSAASSNGGDGGVGKVFTILSSANATTANVGEVSGSDVYYGGGGGGAGYSNATTNAGGLGGGGDGNVSSANNGDQNGKANTGGGAGSDGASSSNEAGIGGSGVVILRYPSSASIVTTGLTTQTFTEGSDKVTVVTSGSGQVYWE